MYTTHVHYNVRLPMRDGLTLSANLWLPIASQPDERFPAILEMIPYRKDDWRAPSDQQRGNYFAQRGFAFCRLDVRGTGSSDGSALDEYMPEETQDGYDAVELISEGFAQGFTAAELSRHPQEVVPVIEKQIQDYQKVYGAPKFTSLEQVVADILRRHEIAKGKMMIIHPPSPEISLVYE